MTKPEPRDDAPIESERVLLAHGALFQAPLCVSPADFSRPDHREIALILEELAAEGAGGRAAVLDRARGRDDVFRSAGGVEAFIDALGDAAGAANLVWHADQVKKAGKRRRYQAALSRAFADLRNDDDADDRAERLALELSSIRDAQSCGPSHDLVSPAVRALAIGGEQRIPTAFATLDANTRGGLRVGKRVIIGGAPGAGKTTWLVQKLWSWARQDVLVLLLCFDEEAEDILIRIGQLNGIAREDLERGDEQARRALADILDSTPSFLLVDGDEDEASIELASAELARRRRTGQLSVLGIDSVQTARVVGDATAESAKARVDLVMSALKRAGKVDKHLVIATCELNRGGYRSNNAAERVDDLAAFKESGGVEYGATMAMVLRSVKDAEGLVEVTVPKNRMGSRKPFRLQIDFHSASMREVSMPDATEAEAITSPMQKAKDKLMAVIEKSIEPITSASELARRGRMGKATALKAVKELVEDGRLRKPEDGAFIPVPRGSGTGSEPDAVGHGSPVPSPLGEPGTGTAHGTDARSGT